MGDIIITDFSVDDVLQVCEIEQANFSTEAWSKDAFAAELNNKYAVDYVAKKENEVVGFIMGSMVCGAADINNIVVAEKYRKLGIAQKLLDRFTQNDVSELTLEVRESNFPAISFYKKNGFVEIGIRKDFYLNPKEDALLLKKQM